MNLSDFTKFTLTKFRCIRYLTMNYIDLRRLSLRSETLQQASVSIPMVLTCPVNLCSMQSNTHLKAIECYLSVECNG